MILPSFVIDDMITYVSLDTAWVPVYDRQKPRPPRDIVCRSGNLMSTFWCFSGFTPIFYKSRDESQRGFRNRIEKLHPDHSVEVANHRENHGSPNLVQH